MPRLVRPRRGKRFFKARWKWLIWFRKMYWRFQYKEILKNYQLKYKIYKRW